MVLEKDLFRDKIYVKHAFFFYLNMNIYGVTVFKYSC